MANYLFPGTIILLKFMLKLFVEQETNKVDLYKALLAFPVDAAFLSVSFASAVLVTITKANPNVIPLYESWGIFAFGLCILIPVIVLCRKSERAFIKEKHVARGSAYSAVSVALAAFVLIMAVNVGGVL